MNTHVLKIEPHWFEELVSGRKTCEIRLNDRDFQRGDFIILKEWGAPPPLSGARGAYTGREMRGEITHVYSGAGVEQGYVVLSLAIDVVE